jgi:hypothetical protein
MLHIRTELPFLEVPSIAQPLHVITTRLAIAKHIAHTKPKVGVGVLDTLVDNPYITIFRIVLVIHMTREALGLPSVSFKVQ